MKIKSLLRAALLVALLFQVTNLLATDPQVYRKLAAWYKDRDPVADAAKNLKKGDIYVISAMGYGKYYPGLKTEEGDRLVKKHDARYVPEASDAIEGKDHRAYLEVALKYAAAYNQTTVRLLKEAGRD
jgi:hypothetical protein